MSGDEYTQAFKDEVFDWMELRTRDEVLAAVATRIREAQAVALEEAADELTCQHQGPCSIAWDESCNRQMEPLKVLAWLRSRATSIRTNERTTDDSR